MADSFNRNQPSVKRILKEIAEIVANPSPHFICEALESNIFEWHFTIFPPEGTDFEGGRFHGKITLPTDYPFKAPDITFFTPNGRFEVNKKICLSITAYHQETWSPSWNIRTIMEALIAFMPQRGNGAVGSLDYSKEERQVLAKKSHSYTCPICNAHMAEVVPPVASVNPEKVVLPDALQPSHNPFTMPPYFCIKMVKLFCRSPALTSENSLLPKTPVINHATPSLSSISESLSSSENEEITSSSSSSSPTEEINNSHNASSSATINASLSELEPESPKATCSENLCSMIGIFLFLSLAILVIRKLLGVERI